MDTHVVIMAGGIGSRFWPMSTPTCPKQFIDVLGVGKSMIQMTVERLSPICPLDHMWIVTSESYVGLVHEQLPDIPKDNVLAEPAARNTAPCIAYACWKIKAKYPEANIVVTPSDALVIDVTEYRRVISKALEFTDKSDSIVTIGIKPTRPEVGYGYIQSIHGEGEVLKVQSFKEKPNLETAKAYLEDGGYLWNAGIFVWNVRTITSAISTYVPQIAHVIEEMSKDFYTSEEDESVKRLFPTCEKISIDYAVMEKAPHIYTIPAEFGWSDVGTWGALHSILPKDAEDNAVVGNGVKLFDSTGCVIHTSSLKKVVIEGLDGYIVTEKDGALLICRLSDEQRIREFHD
ncbi:MAG: mannose-1-phosphate guanylyltransferase [Bacteroidales bacterium]|nr:mannose-1-phosphate guanylyltransferase [Bacteroidales bacterium]